MGSYSRQNRSFHRPSLPAGPAGMLLGSNKVIHTGMANNVQTFRPVAPFSQHTTTGEIATISTSTHWAITTEAISPVRQEIEHRQATYDHRDYRTVREDVLQTSTEWLQGRAAAKANRYRKGATK